MHRFLHGILARIKNTILCIILIAYILFIILFMLDMLINSKQHINIEEYAKNIDYGILSSEQIETFDAILNAVEHEELTISCPTYLYKERYEILTQLGLYLGTTEKLESLIFWNNDNNITLNLDMLKELLNQKIIIDARVDEAVSTLVEGSDWYKLWQISNYISEKITYTDGYRDTITALNGKGVCNSYSMLFYKMATRVGIKTYICYGYTDSGYHSWNMVELNGESLYFDITWYDNIVHNIRYVFRKSSWGRDFQINNKWSIDLGKR